MKQYIITGRFRKDEKWHIVDGFPPFKDLETAKARLAEIQEREVRERKSRTRKRGSGIMSADIEYDSDYDLLELQIREREVSSWTPVEL